MRHPTNNCNFNIITNEVNGHEELAAKRPRASHCQPSSAAHDTSKTADKGTCEEGCYDLSLSLIMPYNVQTTCFIPSTINRISVRKGIAVV